MIRFFFRDLLSRIGMALCFGSSLFLVSCGGSGSGSSQIVTSNPNRFPAILSEQTIQVGEQTSGTFYTIIATDADFDDISFSISGDDSADFNVDGVTGDISFVSPPNYDAPVDSNSDNIYDIIIEAEDVNGAKSQQNLTVTVTNKNDGALYLDKVFAEVNTIRDVKYASVDKDVGPVDLLMDIFSPAGDLDTNRPVLILASGGGFVSQDRERVEPIALEFAQRGYVVATIDYSLIEIAPQQAADFVLAGLSATQDMFAAVRYFRADALADNIYGTRADAIFVGGQSSGGIMAATAATLDPDDRVLYSYMDFFFDRTGGVYGNIGDFSSISSVVNGALTISGAVLSLEHLDQNSAPTFIAHHELDPVVPCYTDAEAVYFTGLILSGGCDIEANYASQGVFYDSLINYGEVSHGRFSQTEFDTIYSGAAQLFYDSVINN